MKELIQSRSGRLQSQIEIGGEDSCLREQWKNDLTLATEMAIMEHFPFGLLGYECARQKAVQNGTDGIFDQKMDELREKVAKQLLIDDPILARSHAASLKASDANAGSL
ncbi:MULTISPECIES: hypothetical protein [Halomonas]|uniref:hypothetical protein n=1 Tax=Halomonas TaxID=2745 RepID=UPI0018660DB5|nr:hypothetical protein [Halomonas citrativorans]